ncbi:MAG: tRNA (adenosine(37)-N6)-dimethylallyltransferase MiaA [Chitinispirillaceae bacterium]|nr:tRNA (adenosine(37)-N6)-dimethylallyltransferase MiaA [Chitinispirillaceae bacterium]
MKNILVICGPTASGKTSLGVALAARFEGEILSCDSRQVYRGMDIGTGKDLSEYRTGAGIVPYHLIDIVDPTEVYTVYRYQRDCYRTIREVRSRNRLPVIVGGTGLYLEAVLRGYSISAVPEDPELRAALMARDKGSLERELEQLDPARYAATDRSSRKRIVRSLEVAHRRVASGNGAADAEPSPPAIDPLVIGVRWERAVLRERIRIRLEQRFDQGMVEEVKRLLDSGIPKERFDMFGLEYKHIAHFVRGEVDFETMKRDLCTAICRFAKRQETWFRGMERRGVAIRWVAEARVDEAVAVAEQYVFSY